MTLTLSMKSKEDPNLSMPVSIVKNNFLLSNQTLSEFSDLPPL